MKKEAPFWEPPFCRSILTVRPLAAARLEPAALESAAVRFWRGRRQLQSCFRFQRPIRIAQQAAADGDQIRVFVADDGVRQDRIVETADGRDRNVQVFADRPCERNLIAGVRARSAACADRTFSARRDVEQIDACFQVSFGEDLAVFDSVTAIHIFLRGDSHHQRHLRRHDFARGANDLAAETRPIPAVFVIALVRQRRMELVDQIAVRAVQLDRIEAGPNRALHRIAELADHAADFVRRQGARRLPAFVERDRGRRDRHGSVFRFASGVRDLDADLRAVGVRRIDDAPNLLSVQARRAALLARQGKLKEARALIEAVPASGPSQQRLKRLAEVQLLRDANQNAQAYALQAELQKQDPEDAELAYDTALLAERIGKHDEMERLLRGIIARQPDFQHAYNALGYSFAERGIHLDEAEKLVGKALEMSPGDPFITDSLAWVKFRRGDLDEALRLLESAYASRPDVEIAAHLGEVLWAKGDRERAQKIWRQGLATSPDNTTLRETLRRLGVSL